MQFSGSLPPRELGLAQELAGAELGRLEVKLGFAMGEESNDNLRGAVGASCAGEIDSIRAGEIESGWAKTQWETRLDRVLSRRM